MGSETFILISSAGKRRNKPIASQQDSIPPTWIHTSRSAMYCSSRDLAVARLNDSLMLRPQLAVQFSFRRIVQLRMIDSVLRSKLGACRLQIRNRPIESQSKLNPSLQWRTYTWRG